MTPYATMTHVVLLLVWLVSTASVQAQEESYLLGGTAPLSDHLKTQLDASKDLVQLGINTDRLLESGLSPKEFVEAVLVLVEEVKLGIIPGAVLYADSMTGDCMPIGIGQRITDPEEHPAEWSTLYELGTLTGPMTVTPLGLAAIERGDLDLEGRVADYVEDFRGSPIGRIPVEQLLRHSSGLPARFEIPADVRERGQLLSFLATVKPSEDAGKLVIHSGMNFLLLGLILEEITGEPIQRKAIQDVLLPIGLLNTMYQLPVQWRSRTAPGPYSEWHGRLAWGEAADPSAFILGPSAGHGGLLSTADDVGAYGKLLIHSYENGFGDLFTSSTLRLALTPDPTLEDGQNQGLGLALNGFGDSSYGWTSENGCALWVDPEVGTFVVLLSNPNHPNDAAARESRCIRKVLGMIRKGVVQRGTLTMWEGEAHSITVARREQPASLRWQGRR